MILRERLNALRDRRPDISLTMLSAFTTLGPRTITKVASGQRNANPYTEGQITSVLDRIDAGEILRLGGDARAVELTESVEPGRPVRVQRQRDFYVIDTVRRVRQVLEFCVEHAAIGIITAEYGVGKTESVSHWRKNAGRKVENLVFEFDEFSARNIQDFVECLADRLGVPYRRGPVNAGRTMRAICAALEKEPMLLIFDQCESVAPRILQVIRQIWDATRRAGVGMVLLASPLLFTKLHEGRMKDIGALTSRVGIWAALRGVQREEAINILRQEGVKEIDDDAFDLIWRATGGSMRRLMAVAELLVAKHAGKPVTERTVTGVAQNLWGLNLQSPRAAA